MVSNIVKIKKAAAIARAESERDIKVAQASADKESNDAAVAAQTEIAKKQNELAIKKSELQMEADTKKAMADAAYDIPKEELASVKVKQLYLRGQEYKKGNGGGAAQILRGMIKRGKC